MLREETGQGLKPARHIDAATNDRVLEPLTRAEVSCDDIAAMNTDAMA